MANTDDFEMPCSTLRAWVIGVFWAILIPGLNQFFFFRIPSVQITSVSDSDTFTTFPMNGHMLTFLAGRCPIALLPHRQAVGEGYAKDKNLRVFPESWSIYHQRTCPNHRHGRSWRSFCVCSM